LFQKQIFWNYTVKFQATKLSAGSTKNTGGSAGRRLGVKKFGGQEVFPNDIIAR